MIEMSVIQVKEWLKSQYSVHVHDEWVEACLDWLRSEHQGQLLTDTNLKSLVYEQWLGSDLSEIAPPVLPTDINKQVKTELKGKYSLQMNCIIDVSESAYSQLQEVKGKVNENVLVTAATQPSQYNNTKSNRMLMLYLTDGHQTLQAMEYKPISSLNRNLVPGTKVLIEGSITCRLGVLILLEKNIKVLGGEVDTLIETNSQIQLLSQALCDEGRTSIAEHFRYSVTTGPITNNPDKSQVLPKNSPRNLLVTKTCMTAEEEILMEEDDFNEDMMQEMKEIEMLERQHSQAAEEEWPQDVEDWPDHADDWPDHAEDRPDHADDLPDHADDWPEDGHVFHSVVDELADDVNDEWPDDVDDDLLQCMPDDPVLSDNMNSKVSSTKPVAIVNSQAVNNMSVEDNAEDVKRISKTNPNNSLKNVATKGEQFSRQAARPRYAVAPRISQSNLSENRVDQFCEVGAAEKKNSGEIIMISDDEEEVINKITEGNESNQEIISLQKFNQLIQGTFKIKGHFTTLITGLSYDTSGWKLSATVADDQQTTVDVSLDDKVLSKLIGFTVLEMMLMKKEMKNNKKEVAQRIKSGLSDCQEALKRMHCTMSIRKNNSQEQPCVVDVDYLKL